MDRRATLDRILYLKRETILLLENYLQMIVSNKNKLLVPIDNREPAGLAYVEGVVEECLQLM